MIITLCGSTKFKEDFEKVAKELALEGHIVLSVNMFTHADNIELTTEQKLRLDNEHKEKINLSDAIYVINKNGYIGESTFSEIDWAQRMKKQIYFLENPNSEEEANENETTSTMPAVEAEQIK